MLSTLRELARRGPVVVAVDDVQWLDPPSAATLEFARRRLQPEDGVRFLLSRRTGADEPGQLDLDGGDEVTRIAVGPLSLGALHRVITAVSATRSIDRCSRGFTSPRAATRSTHWSWRTSRSGEARGRLQPSFRSPRAWPTPCVNGSTPFPQETRGALLALAALSTPTLDSLQGVLGPNARPLLAPAIEGGMVLVDGDRVRFSHPLTRAAVYAEAWPEERRACHRALAELTSDPDERVRHLALASEGADRDLAEALEEAAQRARRRGAPETAATFAEQAWKATPSDDRDGAWRRAVMTGRACAPVRRHGQVSRAHRADPRDRQTR